MFESCGLARSPSTSSGLRVARVHRPARPVPTWRGLALRSTAGWPARLMAGRVHREKIYIRQNIHPQIAKHDQLPTRSVAC